MRAMRRKISIGWILLIAVLLGTAVTTTARETTALSDSSLGDAIDDEDVPYGVAAGYIVGHKLLLEGEAAEALPYLHMAYRAQPDVLTIAMDFQAALAAQGYFKDALDVMESMVTLYPDSLGVLAQRANLYLKSGKTDRALIDLRELRNRGHVNLSIVEAEAAILAADGKIDQALDVYRDGIHLLPDEGPAMYLGMSAVLQDAEQDDRIAPLMDEALQNYPDVPRLWLVKCRVLVVQQQDQEALATARQADTHFAGLAISAAIEAAAGDLPFDGAGHSDPSDLPPDSFVVELADFYAQRGEVAKALAILQPLAAAGELRLAPNLWLGRLLLGTGRTAEGATLVAEILEQWPDSGRAWYLQGKAAEGDGDWESALPNFLRAVELAPRDPEIRLGYVRAMLVVREDDLLADVPTTEQEAMRDDFRRHLTVASTLVPDRDREGQLILGYGFKALTDYERAAWRFSLAAERPELRLNAMLQKSLCHDLLGQTTKARQALETLHEEFPRHPEVANSLGYFLAEKGVDLDQAAVLVKLALKAEPGNGAFLDSMGWIHYRNGELEQALDYLIQAVNVLPDDPVILEHLGMVLKDQGEDLQALDLMKRALARGGDRERIEAVIQDLEARTNEP